MPDQYPPFDPGWNIQSALPAANLPKVPTLASDVVHSAGVFVQRFKKNRYYFAASPGASLTGNTMGNGTIRAIPFFVPLPVSIDRLFAEITTAGEATSVVRLGIYADDGEGVPGALIKDAGAIAGNTTGVKEVSFTAVTLQPGQYWAAAVVQGAPTTQPTVRTVASFPVVSAGSVNLPGAGAASVGDVSNVNVATVGTALPASFQSTGFPGGTAIRVGFRVAP